MSCVRKRNCLVVDAQARWAREAPVGIRNRLLRAVARTCCFPQHSIPSKHVLGRYWYGFSFDTALRHVASRVSGEVAVRRLVRTRRFSVSTDASAETVHKLKLSQTDYRTRMKRPTIYVCPGSFPGEMSRRTARSFKFNYSNPNTNV